MGNNESKRAQKGRKDHRVRNVVRRRDGKRPLKGSEQQGTSGRFAAGDVRRGESREPEEGAGHHEAGDVKHRSDVKSPTKSSDEPGTSSGVEINTGSISREEISWPDKVYTEGMCEGLLLLLYLYDINRKRIGTCDCYFNINVEV